MVFNFFLNFCFNNKVFSFLGKHRGASHFICYESIMSPRPVVFYKIFCVSGPCGEKIRLFLRDIWPVLVSRICT